MSINKPAFQRDLSSNLDADELFVKHSIPELRALERKTRTDIENKKQELRLMVGERYRDLIDAADCIVNMRKCALSIQEELNHMHESCNVNELKSIVGNQIDEDKKGTKDDKKYYLYSSAAQIKLLVDVPEQIWRSLENHKYLNASRLYLIAKLVYKNLQAHNEDAPFSVSTTFPVVQRQWDAVSHFKTQILQKATNFLKVLNQSEQSLAETLSSIMLLDDVTMKDVFKIYLETRTSLLLHSFQIALSNEKLTIVDRIKEMVQIVHATIFQAGLVFIRAGQDRSLFESYLYQLQQGFTIQEDTNPKSVALMSSRESRSSLTRLYSPSTNIHLLIRYLPESIQTFTPFLHTSGTRGQFPQEDIRMRMNLWTDLVVEEFSQKLGSLLKKFPSATDLHELRNIIWEILKEDESSNYGDFTSTELTNGRVHRTSLGFILTVHKTSWSWSFVCNLVLNKSFSIWNDLLRNGFNQRFQDIILSAFTRLSNHPEALLQPRLSQIDDLENEDRDIGKFTWAQPNFNVSDINKHPGNDTAVAFKNRAQNLVCSQTSCVYDTRKAFDQILKNILSDLKDTFSLVHSENKSAEIILDPTEGGKLFYAFSDTENLFSFFQNAFIKSVELYRSKLENLLNNNIEPIRRYDDLDDSEAISVFSKRLLIARVAQAIACDSIYLEIALASNTLHGEFSIGDFPRRTSTSVDQRVIALRRMLIDVYISAHQPWIEWVVVKGEKSFEKIFLNSPWNETKMQTLIWEEVSSLDQANESTLDDPEKIKLPSQPSNGLMNCLFNICQEINRVGSQTLNKGAIQMLFDVKFLSKIFEGSLSFDHDLQQDENNQDISTNNLEQQSTQKMITEVLQRIKMKIDPIDLAVFEPYLNKNVDRHYTRTSILLALLQLNPKVLDIRRKGLAIQDYHNILAVVPQAPRFTLLPITQEIGQ
ncbi:hypothetical protein G9A89_008702 [Geosiphon pyriformis]|nr:hypothetical protein G9A89_008702 [Geosiphon pyriformis]